MNVTAKTILDLLRARHADDVFVAECKDGPSRSGGHQRMDAWAMKRSWRHPLVTAYEIKVSRQDFLRDEKWRGHLPYCNEFYFACAHGIVQPDEIPQEAGLLVGSRNTRRLHTKKKAPYRDVCIPESVYRYVLFSRVKITRERATDAGDYWRDYLADRRDLRNVGHAVSRKLRETIAQRVDQAEDTNRRLQKRVENLEAIARVCERLGIDPATYCPEYRVERQLTALREAMPPGALKSAAELHRELGVFLEGVNAKTFS